MKTGISCLLTSCLIIFAATWTGPTVAWGQITTGTIHGFTTDATGAIVTGARVVAMNENTRFSRSAEVNGQGYYEISFLPVGSYTVTAEQTGFKQFIHEGITLAVSQNARVDINFEVGAVTESITVTTEAPMVDTRQSAVGHVVEERRILELPLNGRSALELAALLPGVAHVGVPVLSSEGATAAVNGARAGTSSFLLDGAQFSETFRNTAMVYPAPDALQEFRVLTSTFSAEYGSHAGGVFNVVTKSGTNQFHGTLWEFLRNNKLNARNFFAPDKPVLKQNQFGAALGGPIAGDKTFFFGEYQGTRIRQEVLASTAFPPTAEERMGDFSNSQRAPKRNPLTGQPFDGNIIPPGQLDPVAQKVIDQFVPLPNTSDGRWIGLEAQPTTLDQFIAKLDHTTGKQRLSGRYFFDFGRVYDAFGDSNLPVYGANRNTQKRQSVVLSHAYAINPGILNEVRFGWLRNSSQYTDINGVSLDDLGVNAASPATPRAPFFIVTGSMDLRTKAAGVQGKPQRLDGIWEIGDAVSVIKGKHTIKTGFLFERLRTLRTQGARSNGMYQFMGPFTGNGLTDFLLGLPAAFVQTNDLVTDSRSNLYQSYIQDDFRLHPRLTLNFGLRYEINGAFSDPNNMIATIRYGQQSTVVPKAPRGLVFPGDIGVPKGTYNTDKNNLAPRVGLAWDISGDGKTSLRAGYGIYYDILLAEPQAQQGAIQPFTIISITRRPYSTADPYRGRTNPFPYEFDPQNPIFFPPVTGIYINEDMVSAYTHQYNLNIQRQLFQDLVLQIGYVGSASRKLPRTFESNPAVYIPGESSLGNTDARRIHEPGQLGSLLQVESASNANYNSFQANLQKRFSRGYSFTLAYTFSKAIDERSSSILFNGGGQNPNDLKNGERGLASLDRRHNLSGSLLWEIPFFSNLNGTPRKIIHGWQLSTMFSLLSGTPFTVTSGIGRDNSLTGVGQDRPNVVHDPNLPTDRSRGELIQEYFDTSAYEANGPGEYGNAGRNALVGPGYANVNLALLKNISITEGRRLQFRAEFFNLFNRVNLGTPIVELDAVSSFGRILYAGDPRIVQLGLKLILGLEEDSKPLQASSMR